MQEKYTIENISTKVLFTYNLPIHTIDSAKEYNINPDSRIFAFTLQEISFNKV